MVDESQADREYTHLSLFSGIGGLDLAAEAAGFITVGQCEWADYPQKILALHWPDVPKWRDIRTLTGDSFYAKTGRRTVDVISGGFPCQPFSVAGKQKGRDDDRYLWPEMLRVIRELKPRWVIGENVPGIIKIAAGQICEDLERAGFETVVFNFEAAAVGAWHRRARICFVAHAKRSAGGADVSEGSDADRHHAGWKKGAGGLTSASAPAIKKHFAANAKGNGAALNISIRSWRQKQTADDACRVYTVCDAACQRQQKRTKEQIQSGEPWPKFKRSNRRDAQPGMGGMVDGLPDWVDGEPIGIPRLATNVPHRPDRIKGLGNSAVPRQFFPIFKGVYEEMKRKDLIGGKTP